MEISSCHIQINQSWVDRGERHSVGGAKDGIFKDRWLVEYKYTQDVRNIIPGALAQ